MPSVVPAFDARDESFLDFSVLVVKALIFLKSFTHIPFVAF